MAIAMKINKHEVRLGDTLGQEFLNESGARKVGLLSRLISKVNDNEIRYDLDNPTLDCFGDDFSCYPCLDSYLTHDRKWQTKASLFARDNRLVRVVFQVIQGQYSAGNFVERFNTACATRLGDPTEQNTWETRWQQKSMLVKVHLHSDRTNADFLIELQE